MDVRNATVAYQFRETPSVYRLGLHYDAASKGLRAARFLMFSMEDRRLHLIPRPFSVSDSYVSADGQCVTEILYKPAGRVTSLMTGLRAEDQVRIGGLCGNGFPWPQEGRRPVLLAGGIGNAPFPYHVRELLSNGFAGRAHEIVLFLAGRTQHDIYIQDHVRKSGITIIEVTDDGSRGEKGRITDALLSRIKTLGPIEAFACGPTPMLRAVQECALHHGFPCHLSVEERMACGYGVCNACVVPERSTKTGLPTGAYRKACVEGPVFEACEILA